MFCLLAQGLPCVATVSCTQPWCWSSACVAGVSSLTLCTRIPCNTNRHEAQPQQSCQRQLANWRYDTGTTIGCNTTEVCTNRRYGLKRVVPGYASIQLSSDAVSCRLTWLGVLCWPDPPAAAPVTVLTAGASAGASATSATRGGSRPVPDSCNSSSKVTRSTELGPHCTASSGLVLWIVLVKPPSAALSARAALLLFGETG